MSSAKIRHLSASYAPIPVFLSQCLSGPLVTKWWKHNPLSHMATWIVSLCTFSKNQKCEILNQAYMFIFCCLKCCLQSMSIQYFLCWLKPSEPSIATSTFSCKKYVEKDWCCRLLPPLFEIRFTRNFLFKTLIFNFFLQEQEFQIWSSLSKYYLSGTEYHIRVSKTLFILTFI